MEIVQGKFLDIGIELLLKRRDDVRDPFPTLGTLDAREPLLTKWEGWFDRKHVLADARVALVPPLAGDGTLWLAGLSSRFHRTAWATGGMYDEARRAILLERSWVSLAHETAHLLGARHDGSPGNIMHPNGLIYATGANRMTFTGRSAREMGGCLATRTKRRRRDADISS